MMGVTSYDVIFIEVYIKSQLNIILLNRPLEVTLVEVFMSIRKLQVPGRCKHDNPTLGGYIIWSIQFLLVTGMNNMDFFQVAVII